MHTALGALPNDPYIDPKYQTRKMAEIINPAPSHRWVFVDEHPDGIDDGYFAFNPGFDYWVDLPASYHNNACGFAFADGHSEIKKWRYPSTCQPIRFEKGPGPWGGPWSSVPIPKNQRADFDWLADRTKPH